MVLFMGISHLFVAIDCLSGVLLNPSSIFEHQVDVLAAVPYALVVCSPTVRYGIICRFLADERFYLPVRV
jgi:hypothetical protein